MEHKRIVNGPFRYGSREMSEFKSPNEVPGRLAGKIEDDAGYFNAQADGSRYRRAMHGRLSVAVVTDEDDLFDRIEALFDAARPAWSCCVRLRADAAAAATLRAGSFDCALIERACGTAPALDLIVAAGGREAAVPFIVVSDDCGAKDAIEAFEVGATDVVDRSMLTPRMLDRVVRCAIVNHGHELQQRQLTRMMSAQKEEAEAACSAQSELIGYLSEELRSPVSAILGLSEIIKNQMCGREAPVYAEYAGDIHDSGLHLLHLIESIAKQSRRETGPHAAKIERVDLPSLVHGLSPWFDEEFAAGRLHIEIDLDVDMPLVQADSLSATRAFLALFRFVAAAAPPASHVRITSERIPSRAGIAIQIGVARTRDGQADAVAEQRSEVELATAQALIELHGGVLDLRRYPDCCVVTTTFPILPEQRAICA